MKKLLSIGCMITGMLVLIQTQAVAQDGDINVGGGLAYGLEIEAIGIQVGGVYTFTDEIRGAADISIFFPGSENGVDNSFWELNINAHYLFLAEESTTVYGLGGINYATQKVSSGGFSASDSEVGLNIGAGAEFGMDFGAIYVEAKYAISNFDQLGLAAGVRFGL